MQKNKMPIEIIEVDANKQYPTGKEILWNGEIWSVGPIEHTLLHNHPYRVLRRTYYKHDYYWNLNIKEKSYCWISCKEKVYLDKDMKFLVLVWK